MTRRQTGQTGGTLGLLHVLSLTEVTAWVPGWRSQRPEDVAILVTGENEQDVLSGTFLWSAPG